MSTLNIKLKVPNCVLSVDARGLAVIVTLAILLALVVMVWLLR